ncbi:MULTISPECIES: YceI family protein [unclassified Lentimonas]|uniref:YceI family protein n=1 Tax=unclassified Lentimonas TaxID=2630993 RepID=UPI00132BC417|nr:MULTISPECIES: YceI family protein [unclassified Lentimonas]CAA6679402.1 Protein yceI precursor [Lentimonas sp. CC4]CAA6687072.1 Protein yceI precursor [Lentimonas sp. CC6]CAA7075580.1 Protein yceI precursor [Lentimonas sp. CC4]CAA7170347.1 Protein yceI precursor [Lentimonas sp. CC21]CAA7182641.1 Protein yceI precursor [Lentimonas sp. CC8]
MKQALLTILASSVALVSANAEIETYKIDPVHSSVNFEVRHFVSKTTGSFNQFEGTILFDAKDPSKSSVEATIKVPSVNTANEKRDTHLQEDDFFNAAKFPVITFKSTKWVADDDDKDEFEVTGLLTMLGVSKVIKLEVELLGIGEGMKGAQLSGWEIETELDRTDWGINGGKPAVGTDVDITINIEAIKQ